MSPLDTMMPLLQTPWTGRNSEALPITPLPGLSVEAIDSLNSYWTGILTAHMHAVLRNSCGLAGTPLGNLDFTGRWYPEEPLSIFRPSLTLAVDDKERRWIAELNRSRGLPGPIWCVFSQPRVAMLVDRDLADFISRLHREARRDTLSQWLTSLSMRARTLWTTRHARAIAVPVAYSRLRELRGWLGTLPVNAWIYDLRVPGVRRGLPYGLIQERGPLRRCGTLPVFAFAGSAERAEAAIDGPVSVEPIPADLRLSS